MPLINSEFLLVSALSALPRVASQLLPLPLAIAQVPRTGPAVAEEGNCPRVGHEELCSKLRGIPRCGASKAKCSPATSNFLASARFVC
eukprot:4568711-Amphidinium_carterae.3